MLTVEPIKRNISYRQVKASEIADHWPHALAARREERAPKAPATLGLRPSARGHGEPIAAELELLEPTPPAADLALVEAQRWLRPAGVSCDRGAALQREIARPSPPWLYLPERTATPVVAPRPRFEKL